MLVKENTLYKSRNNSLVYISQLEYDNLDNEYGTQPVEWFSGIVLQKHLSEDLYGWNTNGEYADKEQDALHKLDLVTELII